MKSSTRRADSRFSRNGELTDDDLETVTGGLTTMPPASDEPQNRTDHVRTSPEGAGRNTV